MMQSYHILEDQGHWIYYGQMSQDDTIPLHSWRPRSPDHFRESYQEWYNPITSLMIEVTGSIMDRCPEMIQSLFILEDRGLRVTLGKVPRDDTIPPHSRWPKLHRIRSKTKFKDDTIPLQHHYCPFRGRSFRTTPSLSRKCSNSTRGRGFVSTSSSKPSSSTSSVS